MSDRRLARDDARDAFRDEAVRYYMHSTLLVGKHTKPDGRTYAYGDHRTRGYATMDEVCRVIRSAGWEVFHLHVWARDRDTQEPTLDRRRSDELVALFERLATP